MSRVHEIEIPAAEYVACAVQQCDLRQEEDREEESEARRHEECSEGHDGVEAAEGGRSAPLDGGEATERLAQAERCERRKEQLVYVQNNFRAISSMARPIQNLSHRETVLMEPEDGTKKTAQAFMISTRSIITIPKSPHKCLQKAGGSLSQAIASM